MVDKKSLSERDICTKFITPALTAAGWDLHSQIHEEVSFTKGRIIVRGKLHRRRVLLNKADFFTWFYTKNYFSKKYGYSSCKIKTYQS